ncbi:MAG: LysM peptidoglycan-binding domain-containing protein [Taibaiella sp.]|nr:LysM peptidoglycan-binding domain-containing protein [Taibaiella sp.]
MFRYIFIILLTAIACSALGQQTDSLFAIRKGPAIALTYTTQPGENVFMAANRFYSTQEKIESSSMVDGRKKLPAGTTLIIPLTKDNFHATKEPVGMEHQERLYYRVREKDNIALISLLAGVQKQDMILWNSLHGNTLIEGQPLFIGWVKVVEKDSINLANGLAYPSLKPRTVADTAKHAYGELDSLYNVQTRNGTSTITEKGTAVFFEKAGNNKIYYAFHNTSQRGAVIKVTYPGTGKTIYAKVLGPIPDTKLYANSIIGICNSAKEALGVNDSKAWCELFYSPN